MKHEVLTIDQAIERNINKTREILESLTLEKAKEWQATNEKFLYIDYEITSPLGVSLCDLKDDRLLNAIEERFIALLG